MIWTLVGVVGFSLLMTATIAANRRVAAYLGAVGAALACGAIIGGMLQ